MNSIEWKAREKKIWHKFHIPGMDFRRALKKNATFPRKNSDLHEMVKHWVGICIGKVKTEIGGKKISHKYISEAEEIINRVRYVRDVVDINSGARYEIESKARSAERFEEDPQKDNITVIKLWELKEKHDNDLSWIMKEVEAIVMDASQIFNDLN